jgi:hypothetical protein
MGECPFLAVDGSNEVCKFEPAIADPGFDGSHCSDRLA